VARLKREFKEQVTGIREKPELIFSDSTAGVIAATPPAERPLEPGMRVRLRDVREPARIKRILNDGRVEVEAGFMKLQIDRSDIKEVLGIGDLPPKPTNVHVELGPKWNSTYREINVVGQRAEDAMEAADKFLDDASLAGVDRVRIVHGFGMGILRKRIGELLQKNPHVAQHYPATPAEGGAGATIVELK
jgi:DNA mismatch repair protein MutS2